MRKIRLRDKQKNILLSILAVIIACIFLFPLYWIIVNSFKIDSEIFSSVPTLWPKKFTITAYKDLIETFRTCFSGNTDASCITCIDTTVFDFFKTGTAEFLFSSNFIYSYYFYSVCSFDVKARFPEYA